MTRVEALPRIQVLVHAEEHPVVADVRKFVLLDIEARLRHDDGLPLLRSRAMRDVLAEGAPEGIVRSKLAVITYGRNR